MRCCLLERDWPELRLPLPREKSRTESLIADQSALFPAVNWELGDKTG
jgi:hypothetical protein